MIIPSILLVLQTVAGSADAPPPVTMSPEAEGRFLDVLPLIDQVVRPEFENGVRSYRGLVGVTPGDNVANRIGVRVMIGSSARFRVATTPPRSAFSASSRGASAPTVTVCLCAELQDDVDCGGLVGT